jgi:hypothetical protein
MHHCFHYELYSTYVTVVIVVVEVHERKKRTSPRLIGGGAMCRLATLLLLLLLISAFVSCFIFEEGGVHSRSCKCIVAAQQRQHPRLHVTVFARVGHVLCSCSADNPSVLLATLVVVLVR